MEIVGMLFVMLLIGVAGLAVQIWALVDAARRQEFELAASGGKTLWVVLLAVGLVVPGFGVLLALVYLLAIRPRGRVPR